MMSKIYLQYFNHCGQLMFCNLFAAGNEVLLNTYSVSNIRHNVYVFVALYNVLLTFQDCRLNPKNDSIEKIL